MVPQFFSWLFDDRTAWEKAIADPRYNYDLPIGYFMALYQEYRTGSIAEPPASFSFASAVPETGVLQTTPSSPPFSLQSSTPSQTSTFAQLEPQAPEKDDDGILSQDEIDALLAGLE